MPICRLCQFCFSFFLSTSGWNCRVVHCNLADFSVGCCDLPSLSLQGDRSWVSLLANASVLKVVYHPCRGCGALVLFICNQLECGFFSVLCCKIFCGLLEFTDFFRSTICSAATFVVSCLSSMHMLVLGLTTFCPC
jgi:hypothetical protein